ncbi:bacillithiol biosynthesis deacetylase BshB2 [Halobacillus karajensis]|uniref:Bacillithiol biosynthesis deacetylase BshB2 n=1 Tax=Halobacillus karajensis TaxID=195088 RepID=A0A059NWF9_9BACI|nr:bacillithiol biosynthesis deacetylase BshB2 [Halobacillus karajensis]CDQ19236.1 bacillithiol biosynthesis deacetylase BshB2 [Halobacillus karajensis]CDQ22690.1 bacillithiol biosynthesis deacetylase BshB2 [Halobacillus karajensis]CDQ26172.1 bacillithiol biosynthesis deacetylase BshB2 [Halobacillus karajensis]SEH39623.1 bacillithiol biosynthesis deacetylase BshB2 [Halobacillus karajensis]
MSKEKVVVIFPHPDDESFGASGTISKFRDEGVPVTYLCGTLGEMGRNMGNPVFANRETLSTFRKKELEEAANQLDIEVEMLGYQDKTLEFEPRDLVAKHLKERLEALEATIVITHYPGYAVHPDHDALGAAVVDAVRQMDESRRPEVWMHAISNHSKQDLGEPEIIYDVRPYWKRKLAAIKAHLSQADGMMNLIENHEQTSEQLERLKTERFYRYTFS